MVVQFLVPMTCCVFASRVLCVVTRITPIENTLNFGRIATPIEKFSFQCFTFSWIPDLVVMSPGDA